ncbi:protein tyrosine kinase [Aureococcus anophagefferens]|nr:protein tyrosine kinase [Aureococcus anophagefferens]
MWACGCFASDDGGAYDSDAECAEFGGGARDLTADLERDVALVRPLGRGSFGTVSLGVHVPSLRLVAVKEPSNVLVSRSGRVKIADLGLAAKDDDRARRWRVLMYFSPERLRGDCHAAADVWALGVTLFSVAAGRHPFEDPAAPSGRRDTLSLDFFALSERLTTGPEPRLDQQAYAPVACDAVAAAMARDPARRATAAQLLAMPFLALARDRVFLCRNQPLVWVVLTKLEDSLARSNRSAFPFPESVVDAVDDVLEPPAEAPAALLAVVADTVAAHLKATTADRGRGSLGTARRRSVSTPLRDTMAEPGGRRDSWAGVRASVVSRKDGQQQLSDILSSGVRSVHHLAADTRTDAAQVVAELEAAAGEEPAPAPRDDAADDAGAFEASRRRRR